MFIQPMLATKGPPPNGGGWAFEWKWDGWRLSATVCAGGAVTLRSRSGQDMTDEFPELAGELGGLVGGALRGDRRVVLDGEVVCLDGNGVPDITLMQDGRARPPVTFMAFDVLEFDGHRLLGVSYEKRRELLVALDVNGTWVRTPENFTGNGLGLLQVARERGIEGVVAKQLASRYIPGPRRTGRWVKTAVRCRREVVIGGWRTGARRQLGALMMGAYTPDGELVYLGDVGTGFTESALSVLLGKLGPLETATCPFQGGGRVDPVNAHWVAPELVGDVEYRTATSGGILRYASWRGIRIDKSAEEILVGDS